VSEHVVSPKTYLVILFALMLGTVVTVMAALKDFGPWNIVIALAIATTKATLVVLYFMHARYSSKRTQLVIVCAVFWLVLLLGLTLSDYAMRTPNKAKFLSPAASHLIRVWSRLTRHVQRQRASRAFQSCTAPIGFFGLNSAARSSAGVSAESQKQGSGKMNRPGAQSLEGILRSSPHR
jgi:cytochrome c oxidase subunit 4